jgi:type II secretory ATPase GspE/PulE/Tfp pilus assembly ATPase PilB-like protein
MAEIPKDEMRISKESLEQFEAGLSSFHELGARINTLPPTQVLTAIMAGAIKVRASDIHIEPKENEARLRYRVDGILHDFLAFNREGWRLLLSRIKVLTQLKLNVRDLPQGGSFVLRIDSDKIYDIRVSTLPGEFGENIVMRILDRDTEAVKVDDLGMKESDYAVVTAALKRVNGMIVVTGPTGSGKTTTLASFVQEINSPELKIITLEDPIEYRLPGVEQTQIDESSGYTFAVGLRSILRQDPDVILVGEMRDVETAETAVQASLTGHLVFSTLHTNDSAGTIPRLVNMGIKPFVLAPALILVIAQRLVRVLCPYCKEAYQPDQKEREHIRDVMQGVKKEFFDPALLARTDLTFMHAKGCDRCSGTGYQGRIGVFEIFTVTDEMKNLILNKASGIQIRDAALKQGMTTLAQDGYLKVINHLSTVEEVQRITEE